ncbi:hypothetical protein AGMMS50212_11440 [Spirochaetia bacterium]|nr:hypothetical protein AGMMS50212_11440 [Spirochaetia bacterium]
MFFVFTPVFAQENDTEKTPAQASADAPREPETAQTGGESAESGEDEKPAEGRGQLWLSKLILSFGCSILVLQEDYGFESAPTPVLPAPFIALSFPPLGGFIKLRLETTVDLYFTHYKWSYSMNCPLPSEIENRSAFVFGIMPALQVQGSFDIKKLNFRVNAGLAADLRVITIAEDLNAADWEDATAQTNLIKDYFWEGARWLFPELGLGVGYNFSPKYSVGLDFRFYFPLDKPEAAANIQGGGSRFAIGVRISRNFEKK